jgi:hypothetical protein
MRTLKEIPWGEITLILVAVAATAVEVVRNLVPSSSIVQALGFPVFLFALVTYLVTSRHVTQRGYADLMARFDDLAQRSGDTDIIAFKDSTGFHEYVKHRFLIANRVKVTHFSARSIDASDDFYHTIAGDLLKRGCAYHRVIADALSDELWTEQIAWLEEHRDKPFVLHYLPTVAVAQHMKLLDVMIIDDVEVCFGGGYRSGLRFPVICVRNREFAQFFADYYEYLIGRSISINTYDGPELLRTLKARAEIRWTDGGPRLGVVKGGE